MDRYHRLVESLIGMKDWNQVVASAKDIIRTEEGDPEDLLARQFTFLDQLEIKRAIEQAQEEIGEEDVEADSTTDD